MQTKLVDEFLKIYKSSFNTCFNDTLEGKIKEIISKLCEPKLHQSPSFKTELNSLLLSLNKPIKVGVIGQFSSGKSSLLNIILNKDILATGVVPVTSKPCTLKYADKYALGVKLEDDSYELLSTDSFNTFSDQRGDLKQASELNIYAPIPLLKEINFLDTPGLDANDLDNKSTLNEFNKMHLIIWLSLIDNAGKKSEQDQLKKGFSVFKESSLCVLNGKDKLNEEELLRVLKHAKEVFKPYFKEIIAISCKEAKSDFARSNFNSIYEFLNALDKDKLRSDFCKRRLEFLCKSQKNQILLFSKCYDELEAILDDFLQSQIKKQDDFIKNLEELCTKILISIKEIASTIAQKSLTFIRQKEGTFYKKSPTFLHKEKYEKQTYSYPFLPADDAYLALFYNNEALNKEFRLKHNKLKLDLLALQDLLFNDYKVLNDQIKHFEAKYSNILRDDVLQSEFNFGMLRSFASASHELFAKDYKQELNKTLMQNELFFEKLNLKTFANYQNATKLSLDFFASKIAASREFYELDPTTYSLYYPSLSEVQERILTSLAFYEFESLLQSKSILKKNYQVLQKGYQKITKDKKDLLSFKKNELAKVSELLSDILSTPL